MQKVTLELKKIVKQCVEAGIHVIERDDNLKVGVQDFRYVQELKGIGVRTFLFLVDYKVRGTGGSCCSFLSKDNKSIEYQAIFVNKNSRGNKQHFLGILTHELVHACSYSVGHQNLYKSIDTEEVAAYSIQRVFQNNDIIELVKRVCK